MRLTLRVLLAVFGVCLAQGASAQQKIAVVFPAILDPSAPIAQGVKLQCGVEAKVGEEVYLSVSEQFPAAEKLAHESAAAPGTRVLKVTLIGVVGPGGGAWSGSKLITIRVDILDSGKVLISQRMHRRSKGGVLGGVSGTCPIMDRIAVALGKDVARWLPAGLSAVRDGPAAPDAEPATEQPQESAAPPVEPNKPESESKQ